MEKVKQRFEYCLDEINEQCFNDAIKQMLKVANEHGLNGQKIEFIKTGISDRYNTYFVEFDWFKSS